MVASGVHLNSAFAQLVIQAGLIVVVSRVLGIFAKKVSQPLVIAEMMTGILLGPSVLGLISPGAVNLLFPRSSLATLGAVSQLGLMLFMFIVGLELDLKRIREQGKAAVFVSHSSIVVPALLGAALAYFLAEAHRPPDVPLSSFMLFIGVAMSITAFPVLARILAEQGLSTSRLGNMALACAAVDDVTAWCLLALVVAVAKTGAFVDALTTIGLATLYVGVVLGVARPLFARVAARIPSDVRLSHNVVAIALLWLAVSSLCTEAIGIHSLFGAFMAGAVIPKGLGLSKRLADRLEDLVIVLVLPLFFALSGLRTQIGLLADGPAILTTVVIILCACVGKFGGSTVAARVSGMPWRESAALGMLMNTRGLMELVVLNMALDLGIIGPRIFSMMVVMAVVTTLLTSPILKRLVQTGSPGNPAEAFAHGFERPARKS
jgi:Kef-type K+ transport system membrane component KefB